MTKISKFARSVWAELTTASNYENDWLGWAKNQLGHTAIGIFGLWIVCYGSFLLSGAFPHKIPVFLFILGLYALKELCLDRWNGFDTIEDILFVVFYGAGGTLISFTEVTPGSSRLTIDAASVWPVFSVFCLHLVSGVFWRWSKANA